MDPTAPIGWDDLEAVRGEPTCRAHFENRRDDVAPADSLGAAVRRLYETYHEAYDPTDRIPDQGAAFVFAYLLERAGIASPDPSVDPVGIEPAGLVDRRPDSETLHELVWERELVPWWIAVGYGVHYSLVIYWLWEDDIPLMRRNVPDSAFERLDIGDP